MTMMTRFRELPMDLVEEEILCYVPATYLKRLGSTCKRWNHLFNGDGRFAKKHIEKAPKQFLVLMLKGFRICPTIFSLQGSVEVKRELSLVDPYSKYSAQTQFEITRVFHCDGLLLCTSEYKFRAVVWNPFTGETKWFQHIKSGAAGPHLVLGYYQEDNNRRYKILSFYCGRRGKSEIYEFNSDSWRTLDDILSPGWIVEFPLVSVSLKGNTYWLVTDEAIGVDTSLHKFDFSTEKSVPVPLPYQCSDFTIQGLCAVREEKLSVLLQPYSTSKTEIWVTNKIDETTQMVSWSKVLALDLRPDLQYLYFTSYLLDEEKKVVMICDRCYDREDETKEKDMIYIVGEDNEVTEVGFEADLLNVLGPVILNYVPSFVQIEQLQAKGREITSNM